MIGIESLSFFFTVGRKKHLLGLEPPTIFICDVLSISRCVTHCLGSLLHILQGFYDEFNRQNWIKSFLEIENTREYYF